jgi:hypothetical protein
MRWEVSISVGGRVLHEGKENKSISSSIEILGHEGNIISDSNCGGRHGHGGGCGSCRLNEIEAFLPGSYSSSITLADPSRVGPITTTLRTRFFLWQTSLILCMKIQMYLNVGTRN